MSEQNLIWRTTSKKTVFSSRVFDVDETECLSPDKRPGVFYTLHASDWVIVVPVLRNKEGKNCFLMVRQWRHGSDSLSIEFPGGVIDSGETPEEAAKRELREETGFVSGHLIHAASLSPNPAIMENQCHIFIADSLENTHKTELDDDEYIQIEEIPVSEVLQNMGHGEYSHGLMATALFLYLQKNRLSV